MNVKTNAITFLLFNFLNLPVLTAQEDMGRDSMGFGGLLMWAIIILAIIASMSSFVYFIKRSKTR